MIRGTVFRFKNEYYRILDRCKNLEGNKLLVLIHFYYFKLKRKNILAYPNSIIKGLKNIHTKDILSIGIDYYGFISQKDYTFLNIQGLLKIEGAFSIGRGCRVLIGPNATCSLNKNSYVSPLTSFIIMHGLFIGEGCAISWNCQFLDEDFHQIDYDNKQTTKENIITISDKVWIGCNTNILKGTFLAKGCVVAAGSVVRGRFEEENCLIGGNPAKVIKRNISWN